MSGSCCQRVEGLSTATLPRDKDPFWDPVEPLLLGTAHLWLQSLAFRIPLEEQLEVHTDIPYTHTSHASYATVSEHGDIWFIILVCRCWGQRAQRKQFYKHSWSPAPPQDCMSLSLTHTHTVHNPNKYIEIC